MINSKNYNLNIKIIDDYYSPEDNKENSAPVHDYLFLNEKINSKQFNEGRLLNLNGVKIVPNPLNSNFIFDNLVNQITTILPNENPDIVPYDKDALLELLQPGDILFKYHSENSDGIQWFDHVDFFLRNIQLFSKLITSVTTPFSKNLIHVSIYTGNGYVSEAIKDGVRSSSLEEKRIRLEPGMTCGYLVIRPTDSELSLKAANIAKSVARSGDIESPNKYSILKGLTGLVTSTNLRLHGVKRYLKAAAYAKGRAPLVDAYKEREFYCSYFAFWSLQAAESERVINLINADLPDEEKIIIPDFNNFSDAEAGEQLEKWAYETAEKHFFRLRSFIDLNLDSKWVSPQRFYGFISEHPWAFKHQMVIIPPRQ